MAVRVDLDLRTVRCSVHDLLPQLLQQGLGVPGEGLARLTVGSELHRVVQGQRQAADPRYVAEVPLDAQTEIDGWSLRVIGRVDGVGRDETGRPVVEEIKTLHFRSELHDSHAQERIERHRWQARIYAYFLYPTGEARTRLVLVDLGGEDLREEDVAWSPGQVHAYLRGRLHALVAAERDRQQTLEAWRAAAAELPFPFPALRPVQDEAMAAIREALGNGRHLLLAAPTGVGKTAAALYPAVKLALEAGKRVAMLTAKTLQQKLAVETLQNMNRGGWRSIQIRAKARMCASREVICHEDVCDFARDYSVKLNQRAVLPTLLAGAWHVDPDTVFSHASAAEVCPFETELELLRHCTAVVGDYNYVFDPTIALAGLADEDSLEDTFVVIDEAHNLVDRAREYFSPRLGRRAVAAARDHLAGHRQRVCRELDTVLKELDEVIGSEVGRALGRREGVARTEIPVDALLPLLMALDAQILPYFTFKRNAELWVAEDPVLTVILTLSHLLTLARDGGQELLPLVERSQGREPDELVRLYCLDASRFTGKVLARSAGCVAMSATLQPFEFYRDLLGFDPDRTDTLALPSPFPKENRLILAVDEVDTSFRERSRHYGRIAELVAELAPVGRNGLVLFPSYAFLKEVAQRLIAPGHLIEVQQADHSDALRRGVLTRLAANSEPTLLLAVLGGVFAEGVDYPGEMLSAVIVVSPALPQVGPERELLKGYFAERYERGFEYAYLIPGMTRVVQAAGRLIRSENDRGVIALVCRRFLRQPYVSLLPGEWLEEGVDHLRTEDPRGSVAAFFRDLPESTMG